MCLDLARVSLEHSASYFIYDFVFQTISEKTLKRSYVLFDRHFNMKTIATSVPIGVVTNWLVFNLFYSFV